jgi:hypothetical protein
MTRLPRFCLVCLACVPVALLAAAPAAAQSTACTPQAGSDEEFQQEIARSWLPFRIGVDVARASCRVHEFFDDLLNAKRARMPSPTTRPGWNPNPTTSVVVLPPTTAGGAPVLYQPNEPGGPTPSNPTSIQGNGTLLSTDGMKRGNFVGGKLNGVGEEIDPNGTWRSGTYEYGKSVGYTFEVRTINGKTYLVAGSVVNGKLDGMIERIYADGSTQFEDWEGGKLMQVGVRAPKGQSALAPQARYKPREEVATGDAYKHTGPRTPIAPGTTFNPRRTTANSRVSKELSFDQAFADYKRSCERIVVIKLRTSTTYGDYQRLGRDGFAEQMYRSANIAEDWIVPLFKSLDTQSYVDNLNKNAFKYPGNMNDASDDNISYSSYVLAVCAVNVRLRQLGKPPLPYWG